MGGLRCRVLRMVGVPFPDGVSGTNLKIDYNILSKMPNLNAGDRKIVQQQLVKIPPRKKAAQEQEMGEMMGKLKGVSHCISL